MNKATLNIDCPVDFASNVDRLGTFANAFRIVPDTEQEWFLDFCSYSHQEQQAKVVARIRVHRSFLTLMQERLARDLIQLPGRGLVPLPEC